MSNERFHAGLAARKRTLGEEYVDRALSRATPFEQEFQQLVTEYCWGTCWADDTLTPRERSFINLGMIAASNRMEEFELHFRGAVRNGLSTEELKSALLQIAVYCGIPTGVEVFRIARRVFEDLEHGRHSEEENAHESHL